MPKEEVTDPGSIEQLQFSIDAVGTIVNTDLPKLARSIAQLDEMLNNVDAGRKRDNLVLKELGSNIQDIDAKLDMLLGKVDMLERRFAELMIEG
ncbi:MAG: hypothetical protein KKG33_08320 [candidate division Zixibacteria bacterium]|nr:hypothetical protein [candidate division Zixibacteria bacterium]MBU1470972.1 hypothetical protein [candidate division Zixibacteria bacterium]MBU2625552.1 hypothetical protein [candidate division Zixibacteria bacterium]